jgi:hypothetical protein
VAGEREVEEMSKELRKPTAKDRTYTTFIEYGLEEIDVIKVTIPKRQGEEAIVALARQEAKGNADGYGRIIEHHQTHDGVGVESYEWWEITFRRKKQPPEERDA